MKKLIMPLITASIACLTLVAENKLILIDTIEAVVYCTEGTEIVTKSDVDRPSLSGSKRSREDLAFERLMFLDAKKYKVVPNDEEIDKYLSTVQRENDMTRDDLKEVFRQSGYSFEEGRDQLRDLQAVNKMIDHKVRSNLMVPKKEVEKYCKEHPEFTEPTYEIEYSFVRFEVDKTPEEQEKDLQAYVQGIKTMNDIMWSDPFWVDEPDIAEDKKFITQMKPNEIRLEKLASGFEMYRLNDYKERREKTINERYNEVAQILIQPRYGQLMEEYKKSLFDEASVLYLR